MNEDGCLDKELDGLQSGDNLTSSVEIEEISESDNGVHKASCQYADKRDVATTFDRLDSSMMLITQGSVLLSNPRQSLLVKTLENG